MTHRIPAIVLAVSLVGAACSAFADNPVLSAAQYAHLSAGGLMLLGVAHGHLDLRSTPPNPMPRRQKPAFRFAGRGADVRINDTGKDVEQMRTFPDRPATTQSEASIAAFGRSIVVGYNDSAALYSASRSMNGYSFSTDGGSTWADGDGTPSGPDIVNVGDPSVVVNRKGVFYYASMALDYRGINGARGVIGVARSVDGGRTFGNPVVVTSDLPPLQGSPGPSGEVTLHLSDKELMAVDASGGPRDGTLYVAWTDYAATTFPGGYSRTSTQIMMSHSADGGSNWSTPVAVSNGHTQISVSTQSFGPFVSGASLAVGPHGEVYCAWEENNTGSTYSDEQISRSDDGGVTFAISESVAVHLWDVGNPIENVISGGPRINEFPSLAVDHKSGTLYLAYASAPTTFPGDITDPSTNDRSNVYVIRSVDRGKTWAGPVKLNDDATSNDQFFPVIAVNDSGTVGAIWYDRRIDPYNQRFDVYSAQSRDGGRSFSANQRVTSASSPLVQTNPNFDPNIAVNYMGDYIGITACGERFLAAWGDNRDVLNSTSYGPRPDPNIYFSPVLVTVR